MTFMTRAKVSQVDLTTHELVLATHVLIALDVCSNLENLRSPKVIQEIAIFTGLSVWQSPF